jgi:predicted aspartyl protease
MAAAGPSWVRNAYLEVTDAAALTPKATQILSRPNRVFGYYVNEISPRGGAMRSVLRIVSFLGLLLVPSAASAAAECQPLRRLISLDMRPHSANVPLVPVSLDGKRTLLIVDTGAFWSFLHPGIVRELNLTSSQVPVRAYGVDGDFTDRVVRVRNFMLGAAPAGERQFFVDSDGDPNETLGENDAAGLLGAELLQAFDVDFDFVGGKLSLFHPDHCEGQVVYWQAPTVAVIPFRLEDRSHINFPITVNGRRTRAMLDTGFSVTTINQSVARRLIGFDPDSPNVTQVGQIERDRGSPAAVYRMRAEKIEFEGITVNNPMVQVIPDLMSRATQTSQIGSLLPRSEVGLPEVIIGMSVISKLHMYIAYKERKLYISAQTAAVEAEQTEPAAPPQ